MASVDGLVTGLDTTTIISQLLQVEGAPQSRLKTKVSEHKTVQNAYQGVNARMVAVRSAAEALTSANTWQGVKATSSNSSAVSASASTAATTGSATFNVVRLASQHVVTSKAPTSGSMTTNGSVTLTVGGTATNIAVTTDTPQGLADAVNAKNLGVRASVLTTSDGPVVQFSSASTGAAQAFTVSGLSQPTSVLSQGADAELTVGDAAAGGYKLTSKDNTFSGLLPGVTIRATAVANNVTVSTSPDTGALADAMQALVSAINSAALQIDSASSYNSATKTGGPLTGNSLTRGLRQQLQSGVSNGVSGFGSLSGVGVKLDRSGTLSFDRAAFLAAYEANPAKVQTAVKGGFAETYRKIAVDATDSTSGKLTLAVQGGDTTMRRLNKEIDDWDTRLAAKKVSLQRQYTNLETALGRLKDQSSWLSSQLGSLPTTS
ncbi:flagellar filament capping protein FliD [Actinophytocola xanthii]|uniref:Flagellar hook-associated protein 2 n=1 Tax=Actinophytocola xanthii TaxID=1912961 RepID=A0A1Q8CYE5_9PSEU|nr:flagellar filament capping protein FliD [Actinophytocola xanthii]OLF19365.1 hypothetical protein BU204_00065 [Actinophytocola xanthii]